MKGLAVVLGLVLLAAGCSGDRGADESGLPAGGAEAESAAGGAATFGTLPSPCGEGDGAAPRGGGPDAQGVEDDRILVGTISDPGFSGRPGLNQELFDAGQAFVQWCNEQGGINGRALELTEYDAAITDYAPRVREACDREFALVGGGGAQDSGWASTGQACGLIDIAGFAATPEKGGTTGHDGVLERRTVQAVPNPQDEFPVGSVRLLADEHPDALDHVGIINADFATLALIAERTREAYEQVGATIVSEQTYNVLGESNWAPLAQRLQEDGVQWLNFVGEGEFLGLLQQAMDEIGYQPEVTLQDTNFYDQAYLEAAGPAADGTLLRTAFVPFEEADQSPATQQYVELVEGIDGKVALLGAQSTSAWLLFAQAADQCDDDGDLTRTCVLETAASVTEWDGGGLHAPADPSTNRGPRCTIVLEVDEGAFVRHAPDEGFACSEDEVVPLEGDYTSTS
ncbi:MAG TPA: ABC transporter substrate-binding protein [Acidimicrobiales bacterium]|nr:ABC transporter substrate-binding protein [Acidimicrobiales bacterium]